MAIARASVAEAGANLHSAKVQTDQVEQALERAKRLLATGAVNQAEFDKFHAAVEVAKANLAVADAKIGAEPKPPWQGRNSIWMHVPFAPIDGVIIDRRVNIGQIVGENMNAPSLFLIAGDLKKLEVWATVKEADIARVAKGQSAALTVDAFPKDTFKGRVSQIRLNATLSKDQVAYTVVLDVDNRDGRLLPYMTAEVTIEVGERR